MAHVSWRKVLLVLTLSSVVPWTLWYLNTRPSPVYVQRVDSTNSPTATSNSQTAASEEDRVLHNLNACVTSSGLNHANITDIEYVYSKAKEHAHRLWREFREIVPTSFNTDSETPCWNATLELSLHGLALNGCIGDKTFQVPLQSWSLSLNMSSLFSKRRGSLSFPTICLPRLFILGFAKSGTTFLYCLVARIANLSSLEIGQMRKEPKWWSCPKNINNYESLSAGSVAQYLFNFHPGAEAVAQAKRTLIIDADPNTISRWPVSPGDHLLDNYCLFPAVLPVLLPHSRYIVIMRNPVDALYSNFWFSCSQNRIRLSNKELQYAPDLFHARVLKTIQVLQACLQTHPMAYCSIKCNQMKNVQTSPAFPGLRKCGRFRIDRMLYYQHVRKWLSVVPREQFLFLTMEEMNTHTLSVAAATAEFLGLHTGDRSLEEITDFSGVHKQGKCENRQLSYSYHENADLQMRDETRQLLEQFFSHYNQLLADLLADSRFLWLSTG